MAAPRANGTPPALGTGAARSWNDDKKRKVVDDSITEMQVKRARGGDKRIKT